VKDFSLQQTQSAVGTRMTCSYMTLGNCLQGNYSDVLVHLSNIYSDLRGDTSSVKNEDSAQGFVRSTTKYWVRTQDATSVKHHILQHLPVFQFKKDDVSSCCNDVRALCAWHGACHLQ